jgi:ribosomal protein S12 methylthiotransferase accessory factor
MIALDNAHLSLDNLQNCPPKPLVEALQAAKKLISKRTGIISKVEIDNLVADEPSVYFARSTPASNIAINGMETMNHGDATSIDPKRALMKAVGESIERYCPAHFRYEDFVLSTYNDLDCEAIHPEDFALFSEKQYTEPGFPFTRPTASTPLRWTSAYSLSHDRPVMVPASFVYIPYRPDPLHEPLTHNPISTGLACGSNLAPAISKAIQEVIERDAFMIMWLNQLPCSRIDLSTVTDPFCKSLLNELSVLPAECEAYLIPSDTGVPVIMVLLRSTSGHLPYLVLGNSADLDPNRALMLALEEVTLTWLGMRQFAFVEKDFKPANDYKNIDTVIRHALAHAVDPELGKSLEFLNSYGKQISFQDIKNRSDKNMINNLKILVNELKEKDLNVVVKELTTVDVDEVGFKVVRVVVPGMQPLDVNHNSRHLGGKRLYEVPCQMGLKSRPLAEEDLNP